MMRFSDYVGFLEALELSAEDAVMRELGDREVECKFNFKGQSFKVHMGSGTVATDGTTVRDPKKGVPNVWTVSFTGPSGYGTTGMSGTASSAVYSRLLGCVKRLFDMKKVNGLSFSPAEDGMAVPYDLFYRTYLRPDPPKGKGFLRVSEGLFLSKELIRDVGIGDMVIPAHRQERDRIAMVKSQKAVQRLSSRIGSEKEIPGDRENLKKLNSDLSSNRARWEKSKEDAESRARESGARASGRISDLRSREDQERDEARREQERRELERIQAVEAEEERVRSAERAERARSDAAKRGVASRVAGVAMRRREAGPLPEQDGVSPSLLSALGSAPWVSIAPGGEDVLIGKDSVGGSRYMRKSPSMKVSVTPDEAVYVVRNYTPVDPGERSRLAKAIYKSVVDARLGDRELEYAMEELPGDLAGAIRGMGIVSRGAVSGVSALKRKAKDIASMPGEVKRYYMPGKSPQSEPPEEFSL